MTCRTKSRTPAIQTGLKIKSTSSQEEVESFEICGTRLSLVPTNHMKTHLSWPHIRRAIGNQIETAMTLLMATLLLPQGLCQLGIEYLFICHSYGLALQHYLNRRLPLTGL